MKRSLTIIATAVSVALCLGVTGPVLAGKKSDTQHGYSHYKDKQDKTFNRIATFPVYLNTDIDAETVAEIVDVSQDGNTLIYTDGTTGNIGFVDITNPAAPAAIGIVAVGGEPISVAVAGHYALVGVNTSPSYVAPSGDLKVIDINTQTIVAVHSLGGQPDSVAVSPDGRYAAIVIENERDEDIVVDGVEGGLPQAPSGFMVIVDLDGEPADWGLRPVSFGGIPDYYPEDAEPEFVDINQSNMAVVTFQENNHLAIVNLANGKVVKDFSAGTVNLTQIDTKEEDPALISLTDSKNDIPREPDGVSWINGSMFVTADEGDFNGGSRGITIYNKSSQIVFTSGNSLDHEVVRLGHYPDDRSKNKGNEPENVEVAKFGKDDYLFVASERSSVVFVYKLKEGGKEPQLVQTLPAGVGPEGIKAIPSRNLFISTGENDDRGSKFRGVLTIYQLEKGPADYPTVISANRTDGTPIPWAALSALVVDSHDDDTAYTIHDSFYQQTRIYKMDISAQPAVITKEIVLKDTMSKLVAAEPTLVNSDQTVSIDAEGIAMRAGGGFWIASEGDDDPFFRNLILGVTADGDIDDVITLPDSTTARIMSNGFEGVAAVGAGNDETLFVAFQREWVDDPKGQVRIGRYDVASAEWTFFYYPLDVPTSPNGGWIGLSEITALGKDEFAVIERDNQANTDATIKRVYKFSVKGLTPLADPLTGTPSFPVVSKTLLRDLLPDLQATGGMVLEKIEGLAVTEHGDMLFLNDNDGVSDSNGETQLIRIKRGFK